MLDGGGEGGGAEVQMCGSAKMFPKNLRKVLPPQALPITGFGKGRENVLEKSLDYGKHSYLVGSEGSCSDLAAAIAGHFIRWGM